MPLDEGFEIKRLAKRDQLRRNDRYADRKPLEVGIVRKQQPKTVRVTSYTFVSPEPGTPAADGVPIRAITTKPETQNDPVATLFDGKLAEGYGPVFANGTMGGAYKVDLGKAIEVAEVKTWSFNQNKNRGTQRFVLFGSNAAQDPGWDTSKYTPIIEVDTTVTPVDKFLGTRVRAADEQSVGTYQPVDKADFLRSRIGSLSWRR